MSIVEDLRKQREELQEKISQTEGMIGKGLSWKDAQFYLEKYREEVRVLDVKLAQMQLGEDAVAELKKKKEELQAKLNSLEQMKKSGEISNKVYEYEKKVIEKQIQQAEKDIVDAM
jgi:chromosome segregation ATPase